jgi:hypothetical protein
MKVGIAFPRIRSLHACIAPDATGRALHGIPRRPSQKRPRSACSSLQAHRDRNVPHGEEA